MDNIKYLIILSGKRHTGKDYVGLVAERILAEILQTNVKFVHVTTEVKREFAEHAGLDFGLMLTDRSYKEQHRVAMTEYAISQMKQFGENYYNDLFVENVLKKTTESTIYIVDCRHQFEIDLYKSLAIPLVLVRINVNDETRAKRGWKFNAEIDNHRSEIDLDTYESWDYVFDNSTNGLDNLTEFVTNVLAK